MEELDNTAIGTIWNHRIYAAIGCECACGRRTTVHLWQDLCKKHHGIKTLKQVKERLRCSSCGKRPTVAVLVRYEDLVGWR